MLSKNLLPFSSSMAFAKTALHWLCLGLFIGVAGATVVALISALLLAIPAP